MRVAGSTRTITAALAATLALANASGGVEIRWAATSGIGYLTEIHNHVDPSPRVAAEATTRLTKRASLGLMGDYSVYRAVAPGNSGLQWRALALVHWRPTSGPLLGRIEPFGQFGIGAGSMGWDSPTASQRTLGPAARLAIGADTWIGGTYSVVTMLSLERLDSAIIDLKRRYPTMFTLSIGIAMVAPQGAALLSRRSDSLRQRFGAAHSPRMER